MRLFLLAGLLALTGCVSPPVLDPPSRDIPSDIDLTGQWTLREARERSSGGQETGGLVIPRDRRLPVTDRRKSPPGSLARLFLESGTALRITQSESAMFVSFDRSVVEEYRFGVLREISIGPVTAQRATGWQGDALVVETLDKDGALLTETWRLPDRDLLERAIRLVHREKTVFEARQLFDRRR